jgi:hypothetical protein
VQDEDFVFVAYDGTLQTFSSSLLLDLTPYIDDNREVDAVHVISVTEDDGNPGSFFGEVVVSFSGPDIDLADFGTGASGTVDSNDLVSLTFSDSSTLTGVSLFMEIVSSFTNGDLDAFSIQEDGSVIGSFASTVNSLGDQYIHYFGTLSDIGIGGTITGSTAYLNNTGVDTNRNLTALFEISIPEPNLLAVIAFGGLGAAAMARRRARSRVAAMEEAA